MDGPQKPNNAQPDAGSGDQQSQVQPNVPVVKPPDSAEAGETTPVGGDKPAGSRGDSKKSRVTITPPATSDTPNHADAGVRESAAAAVQPNTTVLPHPPADQAPVPSAPPTSPSATPAAATPSASTNSGASDQVPTQGPQLPPTAPHYPSQTSILPPQQHLDNLAAAEQDSPSARNSRKTLIVGLIAGLLVILLGGGGAYAYLAFITPKKAPLEYLQHLQQMEIADYELSYSGEVEGNDITIKSSGAIDVRDENNPKLAGDFEVEADTGVFPLDVTFNLRLIGKTVYLQPEDLGIFALLIPAGGADQWYSVDLEETEDQPAAQCSDEDRQKIVDYLDTEAADVITIKEATRHGLFGEEHDGHKVQRFSGIITGDDLVEVQKDLDGRVSEDCIEKSEDQDLKDLDFEYTLYTGDDYDKLELTVKEGDDVLGEFELVTRNYQEVPEIEAPADSRPLKEIFNLDRFGGDSAPLRQPAPSSSPAPALLQAINTPSSSLSSQETARLNVGS